MKRIKASISLMLGIIFVFCAIFMDSCHYQANAVEDKAFYNMVYISIGEYIYLIFLDRENLNKELPEESRPLMIIGALGGLILGNNALQEDLKSAGNYRIGYVLAYPLYLLMGSLTGAITGVAIQQTYRKIFPLEKSEKQDEPSNLIPPKKYFCNAFEEISKNILVCDKSITQEGY